MNQNQNKLICVIGPTASGKTDLAIKIAKKYNGELINADSRQIYEHLNIGTAKGNIKTKRLRNGAKHYFLDNIPIHLINIVKPNEVLTLAEYQKLATTVIDSILNSEKIPILVGGTGLYIDSVVYGYNIPHIEPDLQLRKDLEKKSVDELQNVLILTDRYYFEHLNKSDKSNPRRLIRAIEIAQYGRKPYEEEKFVQIPKYDTLFLSSYYNRENLYRRINNRVNEMLERGFLKEVKMLMKKGYTFDTPAMSAIAYPLAKKFIDGNIRKEEFIEKWRQAERNYARRQITWFKRYDCKSIKKLTQAYRYVKKFLENK